MSQNALVISVGAMLHDIGKFVQGCVNLPFEISKDYEERNQTLYQPSFKGRYTHKHSLYTAAFIEFHKKFFPRELFSHELGEDNLINLAGMHHKPETVMQQIITEADRLSSGLDREEFKKGEEIPIHAYKSTRLVPIMEDLLVSKGNKYSSLEDFSYQYQLKPMSPENIFPEKRKHQSSAQDYDELYRGFITGFMSLENRNDLFLWMQHFESLYKKYTFFIPSARVKMVIPDVSLYHHSKTTASLATALYLYHKGTNTLEKKAVQQHLEEKFLVVAGDFFGIQKFIFSKAGEEAHHRSKILRGRSFAVSLFCELASDIICRELGLSPYSVLLNSAGKFYMLTPNLEDSINKVLNIEERINSWLIKIGFGETSLGISLTPAKIRDFEGENFSFFWQKVQNNLQEKKYSRFSQKYFQVFENYLDKFTNDLDHPLCPFCHKRPSCAEVENDNIIYTENEEGSSCKLCRDHIMIGTNLVKNKVIAITTIHDQSKAHQRDKKLIEPIFGEYNLEFFKDINQFFKTSKDKNLRRLWQISLENGSEIPEKITYFPLNGYVPVYTKEDEYDDRILELRKTEKKTLYIIEAIKEKQPKSFEYISLLSLEKEQDKWQGIDALGILKADVDDLGVLFSCGLEKSKFTISRLYALSTQFNNFFSLYLPYELENNPEFKNIYTVFAGGDDLFLIGPWASIIKLTIFLRQKFSSYACHNKKIHFSAGINIIKSNISVELIAKQAENALDEAKSKGKNSVCLFDKVVKFDEFEKLIDIEKEFLTYFKDGLISKSIFYKINELIEMAEKEEQIISQNNIKISDVHNLKWRAMLKYIISRNIEKQQEDVVLKLAKFIEKYRGKLIIPLWIFLYKIRKYN